VQAITAHQRQRAEVGEPEFGLATGNVLQRQREAAVGDEGHVDAADLLHHLEGDAEDGPPVGAA